jgi:hypothetical protein
MMNCPDEERQKRVEWLRRGMADGVIGPVDLYNCRVCGAWVVAVPGTGQPKCEQRHVVWLVEQVREAA